MVVQRLKDRLRSKFNVAVAELDHQDLWQRTMLGVASISNSEVNLRQVLGSAQAESEHLLGGDLVDATIEIL